jgi:hypothetical protein
MKKKPQLLLVIPENLGGDGKVKDQMGRGRDNYPLQQPQLIPPQHFRLMNYFKPR